MNAEQERIRSYLQTQAAKLTLPQLVERIGTDMAQLNRALRGVPAERFAERPTHGDWSANEIAAHLAATSRSVAGGIESVLDSGAQPERVPDAIEGTGVVRDAMAWWNEIHLDRERLFARVVRTRGDEHLDIKWEHPMFGMLNWREWLLFTRLHDLDHARQLQATTEAFGSAKSQG